MAKELKFIELLFLLPQDELDALKNIIDSDQCFTVRFDFSIEKNERPGWHICKGHVVESGEVN